MTAPGLNRYVVVRPSIVGTPENWETVYHSDRVEHETRRAAIKHGWKVEGHDDWLIAIVRLGAVIGVAWMDDDRDSQEERDEIAAALGLDS